MQPFRLAERRHYRGEPVLITGLDAKAAFPPGMQKLGVALGQPRYIHQPRVVSLHEDVEPRADPLPVRGLRRRHQLSMMGRAHRLQHSCAVQRFERLHLRLDEEDVVARVLRVATRDMARTRCAARSSPGGVSPPASPFAASRRRRRVMTMPLSVAMRCSAGRLAMTPMLSWIASSCTPTPTTPEKVRRAFCAARSIR